MDNLEKLKAIEYALYKICVALVSIADHECCDYGFTDEVDTAEDYIRQYEKEHAEDEA